MYPAWIAAAPTRVHPALASASAHGAPARWGCRWPAGSGGVAGPRSCVARKSRVPVAGPSATRSGERAAFAVGRRRRGLPVGRGSWRSTGGCSRPPRRRAGGARPRRGGGGAGPGDRPHRLAGGAALTPPAAGRRRPAGGPGAGQRAGEVKWSGRHQTQVLQGFSRRAGPRSRAARTSWSGRRPRPGRTCAGDIVGHHRAGLVDSAGVPLVGRLPRLPPPARHGYDLFNAAGVFTPRWHREQYQDALVPSASAALPVVVRPGKIDLGQAEFLARRLAAPATVAGERAAVLICSSPSSRRPRAPRAGAAPPCS